MEKISVYILNILLVILIGACNTNESITRERISIDLDWRFIQNDIKGAEHFDFDDAEWRSINVPHDWSIEGNYSQDNPAGIRGGYLPTGIGWYRKVINIKDIAKSDKYFVEFDGVYMNSDVWLNGNYLGNRPYGYISFSYDLTPYLIKGENVIAVRVDHSKAPSGRWYTGSGIYRHVWLTKTQDVYVPQWGTFVTTPEVNKNEAKVKLMIQLKNETGENIKASIVSNILNNKGQVVASDKSDIELGDSTQVHQMFNVQSPKLWSPDFPNMYDVETKVFVNNKIKDAYITPLGIREIESRGSQGFFLNGKSIKFNGLSNHHDAGAVGAAVPDDVLYYRLKLLKDMGCNALRTTHNPFSPTFYNMCDSMGFLVLNEAFDGWWTPKAAFDYGNYFEEWWQKDLTDFIKRDRNHPSVVMWSIGNEVRGFNADQQQEIVEFLKTKDNTRPVTQGSGYSAPYIDIAGFNGHGELKGVLEEYHEKNPGKPIIGTEITHTLQTRGVYRSRTWYRTKDNPAPWEKPSNFKRMEPKVFKIPHLDENEVFPQITKKYQSSYDNSIVRIGVRDDWNRVEKHDYYLGNFRWTGFDYLGESFGWPARTANFGIIDLAGFPKDHYYLYQSLWSKKPMVHLLPHWTHPGKEGVEIPVVVYTNCESAELFLNEKSLGRKNMGIERQLVWKVPYQEGELTAVAYNQDTEMYRKSFKTAKEAYGVELISNRTKAQANQTDVIRIEAQIVDKNGIMHPEADNLIEFEINGPAKLLGVENGDILDLAPHKVKQRKAFKGKCLLLVQTTNKEGVIEITAKSKSLKSDKEIINIE